MKNDVLRGLLLTVGIVAASMSTFGHHGTAVSYDLDKRIVLEGIVTEFAWLNPHSALYLDVKDQEGKVVNWAIEMSSPGVLTRAGWNRAMFNSGDEVTITVNPTRAGTPVGLLCSGACPIILNGKALSRPDSQ